MSLAFIPSPVRAVWQFGPVPVRAQALFAVAGIILTIILAGRRYRARGGSPGTITDIATWAVPAGLVPAVLDAVLAPLRGGWQVARSWDEALGFPAAAALAVAAAWAACRLTRGTRRPRSLAGPVPRPVRDEPVPQPVRFAPVAGAIAPALMFGRAVAELGSWAAQDGYGRPSSLWWAVEISPAHRLSGFENFPTFHPLFLYAALWDVTCGAAVIYATWRFALSGDRALAFVAAIYACGGFGVVWLGIGHLPLVLGLRAGELGDTIIGVGAVIYLARTRHRRSDPFQAAHKSPLERGASLM